MTDNAELMRDFLDSIREPVLVEGRKDRMALESLGVEGVIELNGKRTILETIEALQGLTVVSVLTDLDLEGTTLRRKLLGLMGMYGIRENPKPGEILARMHVSHVEGLRGA